VAVLMTLEVPGGTTSKYDRVNEIMGIAGPNDAPPGLIAHACGTSPDGIVIVDVWDSLSTLDEFARNRLRAAMVGAEMPDATPQTSPVHNMLFGAGKDANVILLIDVPGFTTKTYDALVAQMPAHAGSGENHPAVMHVATTEPNGDVRVCDLWESAEAFADFARTQIVPAAGDALPPLEPRVLPIYNRIAATPRASA
jgi:hypothetical protein